MWSIWEKEQILKADLLIVGAGFTGLSAAIHYRQINPKQKVVVIDRSAFSLGASTKNAGFACIGSPSELLMDMKHHSKEAVYQLVRQRFEGLSGLREVFGDVAIGKEPYVGYELLRADNHKQIEEALDWLNSDLESILPGKPYEFDPEMFKKLGLDKDRFPSLIRLNFEFPLNTGLMYESLLTKAGESGVLVYGGITVNQILTEPNGVKAHFSMADKKGTFLASKVLMATNAFSNELFENQKIKPGRGMLMLSKPVPSPYHGVYHLDQGNVYFRNLGDRFLIGGGRHWRKDDEDTNKFGINAYLAERLQDLTLELLPGVDVEWEMKWSGIMGFQKDYQPAMEWKSPGVLLGAGLNGMGVALSWSFGKQLAEELKKC